MGFVRFLFGVTGRLDRRGYGLAVLGWMLWLAVVLRLTAGLPDFTTSGRLLDMLWDGDRAWGPAMDAAIQSAGDFELRYVVLFGLLALAFASFLALTARRLHDIGRPAAYAWIAVLPFLGPQAVFYVLLFLPGDREANRYGGAGRPGASVDEAADLSHPPTSP